MGYYSSKAKVKVSEKGIDKQQLSLALNEFLQQRLAVSSSESPVIRVKNLFILSHFFESTEAGTRKAAFSVQVATNTDNYRRILVDLRISPQSVAFRTLHVPSNYLLEEEEEPLRCVVLPSLKMGVIKSRHERPPDDCDKVGWADFVDWYERHHKIHLPDETEDRGYATVVINHSTDPERFASFADDVIPIALLWTESGLSRRDLHGEPADLLTKLILDRIYAIKSRSSTTYHAGEEPNASDTSTADGEQSQLFYPVFPGSFTDISTISTDQVVEKKKKETQSRKLSGFIKSSQCSTSQSAGDENSSILDTSVSTEPNSSQQTPMASSQVPQPDLSVDYFFGHIQPSNASGATKITLEDVTNAMQAPSSAQSSAKSLNRPVNLRASAVRLGVRLAPGKLQNPVGAAFNKISTAHHSDTAVSASDKSNSTVSAAPPAVGTSNPKKRKLMQPVASNSSVSGGFHPPRPKVPKA